MNAVKASSSENEQSCEGSIESWVFEESELPSSLLSEGVPNDLFVRSSSWTNGISKINEKKKHDFLMDNKNVSEGATSNSSKMRTGYEFPKNRKMIKLTTSQKIHQLLQTLVKERSSDGMWKGRKIKNLPVSVRDL
jgi:hypothetical protein